MSNPLLNDRFAENVGIIEGEVMTINGTINKTLLMLFMLVISASYTWMLTLQGFVDKAQMLGYAGAFVALVSIIAMYFTKKSFRNMGCNLLSCRRLFPRIFVCFL